MCNRKDCYLINIIEDEETGKKCYVHYDRNDKIIFEEGDLCVKDLLEEAQRKEREKEEEIQRELAKWWERWEECNKENFGSRELPTEVVDFAGNIITLKK